MIPRAASTPSRAASRACVLILVLALGAPVLARGEEPAISAAELHGRISAAIRSAHEFARDAQAAVNRGRPLPEAVVTARIRQLARDLNRIKNHVVTIDDHPQPIDPTWIETRLYGLDSDLAAAELRSRVVTIEQCLRILDGEVLQLEGIGREARASRLDRLRFARAAAEAVLAQPEFERGRHEEERRSTWAEQLAALLGRLFDIDIPGWASRGSEAILALVLTGGGAVLLVYLNRRRRPRPERTRPAEEPASDGDADERPGRLEEELLAAIGRGEARTAVRLGLRVWIARLASPPERGAPAVPPTGAPIPRARRPESLTSRELLAKWRSAGELPAGPVALAARVVDLHEEVCYGGRITPETLDRLRLALPHVPAGRG